MISLTLFSVMNEQSLIIVTFIPIVVAVLAWVFPFPAIDSPRQESGNDNEEQQSKPQKLNSLLIIRIFVSVICLAVSGMLIYKCFTAPEGEVNNTPSPQEPEITSTPEITPAPSKEVTPSPTQEVTPAPTQEVTPTPPYEDPAQAGHQSSNAYQELLDKCLLFDSSLELPFEAEMLDQTVIRYVEGSFPKSKSGGMYLCKSPGAEQIALLKPHTPVTVHAVRGSLSESTGYAFVETGTGQFGWVAFQSTRGTGIGLAETNDF